MASKFKTGDTIKAFKRKGFIVCRRMNYIKGNWRYVCDFGAKPNSEDKYEGVKHFYSRDLKITKIVLTEKMNVRFLNTYCNAVI